MGFTRRETLFINKSDSYCGSCGKSANPHEETHETVWGFPGLRDDKWSQKGCGVRWTAVSSEYVGLNAEQWCKEMRPDLEWVE